MLKNLFFIITALILLGIINLEVFSNSIWGRPNAKGFFYVYEDVYGTLNLNSDMPLDILQAYIVADSVARLFHSIYDVERVTKNISYNSDTIKYALKYITKIIDYDPIKYFQFRNSSAPNSLAAYVPDNYIRSKIAFSEIKEHPYVNCDYILHLKVNSSIFIPNDDGALCRTLSVFGCTVFDKIKGQILPNFENYLYIPDKSLYDSDSKISQDSGFDNKIKPLFNIPTTNFVFEYCNESQRIDNSYAPETRLFNYPNGEPWVKPAGEYIVFLKLIGEGGNGPDGNINYYSILPCAFGNSFGMFPIQNGFVLDEDNFLGFGNVVPVDEFKQKLRKQIDLIKNYGE